MDSQPIVVVTKAARRNPLRFDVPLALVLWGLTVLLANGTDVGIASGPALTVVGTLEVLPLALRRIRPTAMFALIGLAHIGQLLATDLPLPSNFAYPFAMYAAARYCAKPGARLGALATAVVAGPLASLDWRDTVSPQGLSGLVVNALFLSAFGIVIWFWGDLRRKREQLIVGLRTQNRALRRERDQRARLAAQEERTRIARDMHDVVAHSLSVIVVQADGAAYAAEHASGWEREQAARALATIGETARAALADTRRLVGVLREAGAAEDYAPTSGFDDIPDLVEQVRAAGHHVTLDVDPTLMGHVPSEVGLAAYRIVQEALTNTLKHAGPHARSSVRIVGDGETVRVLVEDDGRGVATIDDGEGNGLIGMSERVSSVGGTLRTGPRAGGGFVVDATMPVREGNRG